MPFFTLLDIYHDLCYSRVFMSNQRKISQLRLQSLAQQSSIGFHKVAFDTRRINQETEVNPRRNLQNFSRSEAFISDAMAHKLQNFAKVRRALLTLQDKYGKEHEWQDSNARVLLRCIDNGLRTNIKDGDYTDYQPGLGSFDYLEQLMHVRYRLGTDQLTNMKEQELADIILSKDEGLVRKDLNKELAQTHIITKNDIAKYSYGDLIEKLFAGLKADANNKQVERSITITIKDSIMDHKEG